MRDHADLIVAAKNNSLLTLRTVSAPGVAITYNDGMTDRNPSLIAAREALSLRLKFPEFLAKLSPKDRMNVERRVDLLESEPQPGRATLWSRLACALATLAPQAVKCIGKQTLQFYIADGKYRMQVFALEDLQDGNFTVYCPGTADEAVTLGLLVKPGDEAPAYLIPPSEDSLQIELLSGASNAAAHYKDMVGWNRKAIQITLPPFATPAQIEAAELLCAIAAQHFAPAPAAAASR
jgi:hypothetical protein